MVMTDSQDMTSYSYSIVAAGLGRTVVEFLAIKVSRLQSSQIEQNKRTTMPQSIQ